MQGFDKIALVTGGARRIGAAIVEDLAANGFAVAIHGNRSATEAAALAAAIVRTGGKATAVEADVTQMSDVETLIERASAAFGPIRLLVNGASIFEDDCAVDPDFAVWERHFAIHLKAPVLLASKLARQLPQGQEGLVVNIVDQRVWKLTPQY